MTNMLRLSVPRAMLGRFVRRHVIAFASCLFTLVVSTLLLALWPYDGISAGTAFLFIAVPLLQLTYFVALFAYGCDNDLLASESCYPTHILRLPLASRWLVLWPVVGGTATIVVVWLVVWTLVLAPLKGLLQPFPFSLPPLVTPMIFISSMAWLQATLWANYRHPFLRALVAIATLLVPLLFMTEVLVAGLSERTRVVVVLMASFVAVGIAVRNVHRARTGENGWFSWPTLRGIRKPRNHTRRETLAPAYEKASGRTTELSLAPTSLRDRILAKVVFSHPLAAQVWYEWRRYGLPIVLVVLACEALMLYFCIQYPASNFAKVVLFATPIAICGIASLSLGGLNHHPGDRHVSIFFASRPVSSLQYVFAKWLSALVCAALLCGCALVALLATIYQSIGYEAMVGAWESAREQFSAARLIAGGITAILAYVALTWTNLVQVMPVRLSGRGWLETLLIVFAVLIVLFFSFGLSADNAVLPWTILFVFAMKFLLSISTLVSLESENLIPAGATPKLLGCWFLMMLFLTATVFGFTQTLNPPLLLVFAPMIVLLLPMTRLTLAPLALHWNRHR